MLSCVAYCPGSPLHFRPSPSSRKRSSPKRPQILHHISIPLWRKLWPCPNLKRSTVALQLVVVIGGASTAGARALLVLALGGCELALRLRISWLTCVAHLWEASGSPMKKCDAVSAMEKCSVREGAGCTMAARARFGWGFPAAHGGRRCSSRAGGPPIRPLNCEAVVVQL